MPRIDLMPSYSEDSALQFNATTCKNINPVLNSTDGGKGKIKLRSVYGYEPLSTFSGDGVTSYGGVYVVSPNKYSDKERCFFSTYLLGTSSPNFKISELLSNGNIVDLYTTTLTSAIGQAKFCDNGEVLNIVSGSKSYFYNLDTGAFNEITDPDFPSSVVDVVFKDTYFVWLDSDTNSFYISDNYATDPTDCVNALDFTTIESNPDNVVSLSAIGNEVAVFGDKTIEFYYNSGNVDFPFERNSGATIEIGTKDRFSNVKVGGDVYFIGSDYQGSRSVYVLSGYQIKKISDDTIDAAIERRKSDSLGGALIASAIREGDSLFYCINHVEGGGPSSSSSLFYNINLGLWHERESIRDDNPLDKSYGGEFYINFAGKNLMFKKKPIDFSAPDQTFKINEQKKDHYYFTDSEDREINRLITLPHITTENKNIQINYFEMDVQKGVGNVDDPDPEIRLYISRDGGMTYGNPISMKMGASGSYKQRVRADMLGMGRDFVFKLESDSPVQQEWFTAYIDYEVMSE